MKQLTNGTIISRVGFCDSCSKSSNPRTGGYFVVVGSKGWHIYKAQRMGKIGFVPINYHILKAIGENIVYETLCSTCGVDVYWDSESSSYKFDLHDWTRGMMTLKDWNALQQYKHDLDYEI